MMTLEERFVELYITSYREWRPNKSVSVIKKKWKKHTDMLFDQIDQASTPNNLRNAIADIRKDYYCLGDSSLSKAESQRRRKVLRRIVFALVEKELMFLRKRHSEETIETFYQELSHDRKLAARAISIEEKFRTLDTGVIAEQIASLVQTDPTVEFPKAREMTRRFHLHLGPTNSGKTYDSIQKLKEASKGVYLGPLRLLALEIYDTLTDAGVSCSMLTGEEHIYVENASVISQTIETLDIGERYDIAVIDEAQMIEDNSRGHAWSRAVLGIMADDIYVCASANVKDLLIGIIEACGDTWDITTHERKTKLVVEDEPISLENKEIKNYIRKGDCLIAFSKRAVLDLAARLEMAGFKASVIYGKLPPETRKREVARFTGGETEVVVATDAIGMGVNLPIRRIIMTASRKFDGHEVRPLEASEVLQIAGRAGRFGIYDEGLVTSSLPKFNKELKYMLSHDLPPVTRARLGFPKVLLTLDGNLDVIIRTWEGIKARPPYEKISTEEMIVLYNTLKLASRNFSQVPEGDDKEVLYGMISVPLDVKNSTVVEQWVYYCKTYVEDIRLAFPELPPGRRGKELERYEDYYKLLDLYHLFSNHMGKELEEERLRSEKERCEAKIEEILAGSKNGFVRRCMYCRKPLDVDSTFRVCDECHSLRYRGIKLYR